MIGHRSCAGLGVVAIVVVHVVAAVAASAADEPTRAEEGAFRVAVERVAAAVVRIEPAGVSQAVAAGGEAAPTGPSTGIVVDREGLVLTTAFAVPADAAAAVVVLPDGRRLAAEPLGRDPARGVVLLRTDPITGAVDLEPAPRAELRPGQWTIAVGRAWSAAAPSVAVGVLSAVDRGWGLALQTDASVSPMNYGGPLVDIAGRVIGILAPLPADTAGMTTGTELYDAGIGFAVPLEDVLRELPRLRRGESLAPGLLGIGYRSRDAINGEPVIATVRQGSPAARAGLRAGDRIVAIDGAAVTRIADVRHRIVPRHSGDALDIVVERPVAAGEPARVTTKATLVDSLPPWRRSVVGIVVEEGDDAETTRVAWVLPGSPADTSGIVAGDTVRSIAMAEGEGPAAVESPSPGAVAGFLASVEPGQRVRIVVVRDGGERAVDMPLVALPAEVPDAGPPFEAPGNPLAAGDAASVVRLEAAEVADPPLAVIPRGTREAAGVVVYFGPPHGPVAEAEATAWKAAVAATGVAVILPGSSDPRQWSRDDIPGVIRGLQSLDAKRKVDPARIAVAGSGAGGAFAWLVAERLDRVCRGVAVADAALPRGLAIEPAEPGSSRWILLGGDAEPLRRRMDDDRRQLEKAGHPVGMLPAASDGPPAAAICRWVSLLGLL